MYEPVKELGQNFLRDEIYARIMVDRLGVNDNDDVIEIGSGLGVVTRALDEKMFEKHFTLFAVEVDSRFIPKIEEMFINNPEIIVVQENILQYLPRFRSPDDLRVIGSLPFYITSPIIHAIIEMEKQPESAVILIQKEVAKKIASSEPDNSYMSVFVQSFYEVDYVCDVPRGNFIPEPEVDGAILHMTRVDRGVKQEFVKKYQGFLHKAFANPRKMLNKAFDAKELALADISSSLRAEAVSVSKWIEFFNKLCLSE